MTARAEHYALFETAIGRCGVAWSDGGLRRVGFPEANDAATEKRVRAGFRVLADPPPAIAAVVAELQRYFAGERVDFASAVLDLAHADEFHRGAYDAARRVGWGATTTYGELAAAIGMPHAAQGIGHAMSRNPIPVIIPCHRVLAAGRRMGGFSAYGGTLTKRRLLAIEGVTMPAEPMRLPGL